MAIEFLESAEKHGFTEQDAIHAMMHPRITRKDFDESRVGGQRPTLYIGPSLTPAAPLIEVMAVIEPPDTIVIFHVMKARAKFLPEA